ncbi:PucR family transcriptional regulator [Rhodococcus wratislaviensis]|uniref:PucR family transcriptional regulator n=1 Tax=Rhodococcus wratislaviensis TaxID=44752 RepID=UPI0035133013
MTAAGYDSLEPIAKEIAAAIRPNPDPPAQTLHGRVREEIVFAARTDIAWDPLEDALRAGMTGLWEWMMATIPTLGVDRSTQLAVIDSATRTLFRWLDQTIRYARSEFFAEKARVGHTAARRRAEVVRDLVAGRPVREEQLGYPLMRWHRATIIWRPGGTIEPRAIRHSTERYSVMSAEGDNGAVWAFVATTDAHHADSDAIMALGLDTDVRVAAGSVYHGSAGLVRSFQEASDTYALALRKLDGRPRKVVNYREVNLETLLMRDQPAASRMANAELGELAEQTTRAEKIRETLKVYLEQACSTTGAARELGISERTIRHRLVTAEHMLGRPIRDRIIQLGAAVRVHDAVAWRDFRSDESVLPLADRSAVL